MTLSQIVVAVLALGAWFFLFRFGKTSSAEAHRLVESGAILVDVRTPGEFSGGHIPGAINIPLDQISGRTDEDQRSMTSNEPTPASPGDEAELVRAAQGGDAAAIAALLARYEGAIYRLGLRFCKDPEDARDVLQETLLAAARGLRAYRGEAALGSWLYAIARSFCIKQRRRRRSTTPLTADGPLPRDAAEADASELADAAILPDEAAMDHELGRALQRAVDGLAPGYRDVLVLRDVEGMTAPEVAAALGIGVDAVKSRLHRARVAVREKLSPLMGKVEAPAAGCPDVLALFSRRLEGEVDAQLCEAIERHVDGCPRCAAACDGLKRTLSLCAMGRAGPVPERVQAGVRSALREMLRAET